MNTLFKINYYKYLNQKKPQGGFTLLELLIVTIIIGILAAVAMPNLLAQVSKGRQSEAKNNLGMLNRIQEAYRWEHGVFATDKESLQIKFNWVYYELIEPFNINSGEESLAVTYYTQAKNPYQNDILDYAAGAMQTPEGVFFHVVCEELYLNSNNNTTPDFADFSSLTLSCDARSKEIK